jgi:hypothetical protein
MTSAADDGRDPIVRAHDALTCPVASASATARTRRQSSPTWCSSCLRAPCQPPWQPHCQSGECSVSRGIPPVALLPATARRSKLQFFTTAAPPLRGWSVTTPPSANWGALSFPRLRSGATGKSSHEVLTVLRSPTPFGVLSHIARTKNAKLGRFERSERSGRIGRSGLSGHLQCARSRARRRRSNRPLGCGGPGRSSPGPATACCGRSTSRTAAWRRSRVAVGHRVAARSALDGRAPESRPGAGGALGNPANRYSTAGQRRRRRPGCDNLSSRVRQGRFMP